ncbi:hypothetical protein SRRS_21440 [Sporomusa rhizae]|uniref:hypothetical protein n=1 Tax=Sporomusa rhizae TaxID=357999 RepID=UPI00352B1116
MPNSLGIFVVTLTLMLTQPIGAAASTFSISNWQTSGSQQWHITFPGNSSGPSIQNANSGASELYYPHSGNYATVNYEESLSPVHKVQLEVGILGSLQQGTGNDSDWDYSHSPDLWYYGMFRTSGSSTLLNLNFKHAINPGTELFYGYGYSNSLYTMKQGYYSVMNYNAVSTSLPNLDSTYSIVYHGPHIGVTETKQLTPKLALVGSIAYAPLTVVEGHGWWNLRELDFKHTGTGQMLDGKIGLKYLVAGRQDNSLTVGYRYQRNSLYTGTENTSSDITWTKATQEQYGWYMGGEFKF